MVSMLPQTRASVLRGVTVGETTCTLFMTIFHQFFFHMNALKHIHGSTALHVCRQETSNQQVIRNIATGTIAS